MSGSDRPAAARIGVVLHDFPAGGTERIIIRLADAWAAAGRNVTLFCGTEAGPARTQVGPQTMVRSALPTIRRGLGSRLRLGRALRGMIADHPVDILVGPGNFHLWVLHATGRLPCPIVCKLSNPLVRTDRGRLRQRSFDAATWLASRQVDGLVAMSTTLANEANSRLGRPVETIAEPILVGTATSCGRRTSSAPIVLCAGRMVPQKDFSLALRAFAALGRDDARLILLGDGPERPRLEALAETLGIARRTDFIGHVPDIAPWLARADAFLLSSAYEGYPAVLVEAIAAGVPVATTACSPAIPEILFDPSFGVAAPADPVALAAALRTILAGSGVDEAARQVLVDRHCAERSAARWLDLLDRVVTARAA